jgi:methylphosphotriester-DNA--protein-cysteine methyltransferase
MEYEKPVLQRRAVLEGFLEFLLPGKSLSRALDWRAQKLKEFIDAHPETSHWCLDEVCNHLHLGLSGRQARRLFKTCLQIGFRDYAKNRRLAFAAARLQATNVSVKAIAIDAGYQSSRHFARSFKELFELRPLEFRKAWGRRDAA